MVFSIKMCPTQVSKLVSDITDFDVFKILSC